ncbi:MAG: type IV toxin-antitoxin system AbiEi family antitoxin domain-containing protein [Phycisphaerae bacterium]|nr:type IV toxin-antitoxin system AbiEi family antitoxin domain-containing protein [Phycisphaerae bacterium]
MAQVNPSGATPALQLVQRLAAEGFRIFSTEDVRKIAPEVGLSKGYVLQALHHLARTGWLVRLRKGLYTLSSTIPGVSPAHEFEVGMALVDPAAISHFSAMHHYELTDQIPHQVFITTTSGQWIPRGGKDSGTGYRVGDTVYQFIRIKPERFFGTDTVWVDQSRVTFTDMARTLVDGLMMPQYCGGIAEVLHGFQVARDRLSLDQIIDYALRLDSATAKRLGWILEHTGLEPSTLTALEQVKVTGYSKLDPTGPRDGPYNRHWMIQENLSGKVHP